MDLVQELLQFLEELKQYKEILTNPDSKLFEAERRNELFAAFPFLQEALPKRSKEEVIEQIRENLVRKTRRLKTPIIELTGKEYVSRFNMSHNIWDIGLSAHRISDICDIALDYCIDAVNEAIGKLQKQQEEGEKLIQDFLNDLEKPPKVTQQRRGTQEMCPALFDALQFHSEVVEASKSCFTTSNYREAILDAFISLIDYIKEITEIDLGCDDLMNQVFSFTCDKEYRKITKYPTVPINELKNRTDRDKQQGFMFLCKGAAAFIRNPKAHKLIAQTDTLHTLEYLAFASMLFKQLDKRIQIRHKEHQS